MGLILWANELLVQWGLAPKPSRAAKPDHCVFCRKIANRAAGGDDTFVYEDDEVVVFKDWRPAARRHYLVCPRNHITSARALDAADAGLARRMLEVGKAAVAKDFGSEAVETRFGYHMPPFNSVDHLHMHAFALPFDPEWKERKYSVHRWARFAFMPADEVIEGLDRRRREGEEGEARRGGPGDGVDVEAGTHGGEGVRGGGGG